jgi:hypothetical protein
MKKQIFLMVMATFFCVGVYAQRESALEKTVVKKVGVKEVPAIILEGVEDDFGGEVLAEYAVMPVEVYQDEWQVTDKENNKKDYDQLNYYTVFLDGKGVNGQAVYDKDGNLLVFKAVIKDHALPGIVSKQILQKYPGWKIATDQEILKYGNVAYKHIYKVTITKGGMNKKLHFDQDGKMY